MQFTEGTQGGDIASYISGEWVYPEILDFSKRWLEINLLRNLLSSFSILRNGNWCEIFPLSFLTLPRSWVKGKTYTEIKQNGRWTAIWHLWLETSSQKNTWLYFQLWCSWHLHSYYPDFWKLKGGGLYLFSVCTVQSFVSTKVSKRPSAAMETWRALVPHPKDMQWMQCEEMLDTWLMYLTLW